VATQPTSVRSFCTSVTIGIDPHKSTHTTLGLPGAGRECEPGNGLFVAVHRDSHPPARPDTHQRAP
jgi:hypothetical protein